MEGLEDWGNGLECEEELNVYQKINRRENDV